MKTPTQSRRTVLKKAAFIVPTAISFKITELKVRASGLTENNDMTWPSDNDQKSMSGPARKNFKRSLVKGIKRAYNRRRSIQR